METPTEIKLHSTNEWKQLISNSKIKCSNDAKYVLCFTLYNNTDMIQEVELFGNKELKSISSDLCKQEPVCICEQSEITYNQILKLIKKEHLVLFYTFKSSVDGATRYAPIRVNRNGLEIGAITFPVSPFEPDDIDEVFNGTTVKLGDTTLSQFIQPNSRVVFTFFIMEII